MDPARELAQLVERELELLLRTLEQLERSPVLLGETVAGEAEREGERDEPLLRAVVEVALEALAVPRPALSTSRTRDARSSALGLACAR